MKKPRSNGGVSHNEHTRPIVERNLSDFSTNSNSVIFSACFSNNQRVTSRNSRSAAASSLWQCVTSISKNGCTSL